MAEAVASAGGPSGIGGWLILPAIGIVVAPVQFAMNVADVLPKFELLEPGTLLHTMKLIEIVIWIGFTILATATAIQFFTHKKNAPKLYIALLVAQLLFFVVWRWTGAILFDATMLDVDALITVALLIAACAIWIPYFRRSVRVGNTFVS